MNLIVVPLKCARQEQKNSFEQSPKILEFRLRLRAFFCRFSIHLAAPIGGSSIRISRQTINA